MELPSSGIAILPGGSLLGALFLPENHHLNSKASLADTKIPWIQFDFVSCEFIDVMIGGLVPVAVVSTHDGNRFRG
jgi:hypothetical protein